jgi:hypothetical protein
MDRDEQLLLHELLTRERVLSLGVLVEGKPYVGLLPFAVTPDFRAVLIHASQLARHSRGLLPGAPFSAMVHRSDRPEDPALDPLQIPRLTVHGKVVRLERDSADHDLAARAYVEKFPDSARTFALGDFNLYQLELAHGRLVAGFARARNVSADEIAGLPGALGRP